MTLRFVLVGIGSGILFGLMDGLFQANPLARRLYGVFDPIARKSVNVPMGFAIDLIYGFALASGFMLLFTALPGGSGLLKGLVFAGLVWFARVFMQAASQWIMFTISIRTLLYTLLSGLVEMLILGVVYGVFLGSAL